MLTSRFLHMHVYFAHDPAGVTATLVCFPLVREQLDSEAPFHSCASFRETQFFNSSSKQWLEGQSAAWIPGYLGVQMHACMPDPKN